MTKKNVSKRKTAVVGMYVDDAIAQAFGQFEHLPDVTVIPRMSRTAAKLHKRILGLSRRIFNPVHPKEDIFAKVICRGEVKKSTLKIGDAYDFLMIESPQAITPAYILHLRKYFPGSRFFLFMVNSLREYPALTKWIMHIEPYYDLIISCNKNDAEKNGWMYHPDCYTAAEGMSPSIHPSIDVVFLASDKGRGKIAYHVYKYLTAAGFVCDFTLVGNSNSQLSETGFRYVPKAIPYIDYLQKVMNARCILEITAYNQEFCTLRTMEAVTYGKLLLATNKSLEKEPFFDADQMLVFNDIDSIDISFLKREKTINVSDVFSPNRLLKDIMEEFANHE